MIILKALYFKLRCSLSYRNVEELLPVRDVKVDHATIQRLYLSALPV
jgi:putative transposase